ncbi:hypothetical protein ACHAW6_008242 [Cyclotella cf. meneghiniana]
MLWTLVNSCLICHIFLGENFCTVGTSFKDSQRAFLRILEDTMWDTCEKEGEDEMLDDLVISKGCECEGNSDGLELLVTKKQ